VGEASEASEASEAREAMRANRGHRVDAAKKGALSWRGAEFWRRSPKVSASFTTENLAVTPGKPRDSLFDDRPACA
jgi:hypothetical protein